MVSFFLSVVSGVVLSAAFAPLGWWFCLPLAVAIFLYAVTKTRRPYITAFVFGVVFNYLTLSWTGTFVGLIPTIFLVLLQSLFYVPLGLISFKRGRVSRVWLVLPVLLICDALRSIIPFGGFGWNRLSFSQAEAPYRLVASYFGDSSLSFVAILIGIAFYLFFARAQLVSVALIMLVTTFAIFTPAQATAQGSVQVLAIQGNVPQLGLDFNARAEEVFKMHVEQTNLALSEISAKPDVILWPENAVDVDPFVNKDVGRKIADLAMKADAPIIAGVVLKTPLGPQNASIMWNKSGEVASTYIKRALTPFGEYIPLRSLSEIVSPLSKNVTDFVAGNQKISHMINNVSAAPVICYELIDDVTVRSSVEKSNVILVQTNNATFANSGQSAQQLNISRIRAIENNRWLVSVSTTGVSAVVDNQGNVVDRTKQNAPDYLYASVGIVKMESVFHRLGPISGICLILISLAIYLRKRRHDV
jgi:apolipoprotein N-acyltransferase